MHRPDDPRLGEIIEYWSGDENAIKPIRPVLIGFPQDEGVRRNHGRPGAALAPQEIRRWLYRLNTWDPLSDADLTRHPPLDLGDVAIRGDLEDTQAALAEIVCEVLRKGAIPIVLGGGHETAYGHYLGYVQAGWPAGIINIDAHLDVRPLVDGKGHSGSPFFQALEHPDAPLRGDRYVCLGAQPHCVSKEHFRYACNKGATIHWAHGRQPLSYLFFQECKRLEKSGCQVYLSIDADAVAVADVPGVSAPNGAGLSGLDILNLAMFAGQSSQVTSLDLVEINPLFDRDGQSARWAALVIWNFLVGLACRFS